MVRVISESSQAQWSAQPRKRSSESAAQTYRTDRALAVLLVIMTLGVVLRTLITLVQRKFAPWVK